MSDKPTQSPLVNRLDAVEKRLRHIELALLVLITATAPELLKYLVG